MPNIPCYVRTRRREWCLSQNELAHLAVKGDRSRVSKIECGLAAPKGSEILAYAFIFGCAPEDLFPAYTDEIQDAVMAAASGLSLRLEDDDSPKARRKSELLQNMLDRVTNHVSIV